MFTICIIEGKLWADSTKLHHEFRLADLETGRILDNTLEVHTLELGWFDLREKDLEHSSVLDQWLFWLLHAQQYDKYTLKKLFPSPGFIEATDTIDRIARITEDKSMYDMREKRLRDQKWLINSATRDGLKQGIEQGLKQGIEQGIELGALIGQIVLLQKQLGLRVSTKDELLSKETVELNAMLSELELQLQDRRI